MKKTIYTILLIIIFLTIAFSNSVTSSKYVIKSELTPYVTTSIDKIAPNVTVIDLNGKNINNENNQAIGKINIKYTDDLSGIGSAIYKYNPTEENFSNCIENNLINNSEFNEEGWYDIEITDNAGNTTIYHFYLLPAVCRIDDTYFKSISSAVSTITGDSEKTTEIVMLTNTKEDVTINQEKNAILNIDNYIIKGAFLVEEGASLNVKNGTINSEEEKATFEVYGTLNVESGSYTADGTDTIIVRSGICNILGGEVLHKSKYHAIHTYGGQTTVSGGYVSNVGPSHAINISEGIFNVTGGNISVAKGSLVYIEKGEVNLTGGQYKDYEGTTFAIDNRNGTLNISNISIHSPNRSCINTYSITNINGGTYTTGSSGHALNIMEGTVKVNNATFGSETIGTYGAGIVAYGGDVSITDCTVYNKGDSTCAVSIQGGKCTINGGKFTASDKCSSTVVCTNSILNIENATINCDKTIALNVSGGTANILSGYLTSKNKYTICVCNAGILNAQGGTIENTGSGYAIYKVDGTVNISDATIIENVN